MLEVIPIYTNTRRHLSMQGDPHRVRLDTTVITSMYPPGMFEVPFLWGSVGVSPGGTLYLIFSNIYTIGL